MIGEASGGNNPPPASKRHQSFPSAWDVVSHPLSRPKKTRKWRVICRGTPPQTSQTVTGVHKKSTPANRTPAKNPRIQKILDLTNQVRNSAYASLQIRILGLSDPISWVRLLIRAQ